MKNTAIIIDDEINLRKVLKYKLEKHFPDLSIIDEASNVKEAIGLIDLHSPDIIFLDIAMPGGSGFDLVEHYDQVDFEIIFVTGYNEYALDALKLSAIDYLLKPIKDDSLIIAVKKALAKVDNNEKLNKYETLKHNLERSGNQQEKIAIPGGGRYDFIAIKDIIRCEGWQKYTKIYIVGMKPIVSSYNLGLYRELLDGLGFVNCHKSHIINKTHITQYKKTGIIIMSDDSEVPVSRRKREDFFNNVIKPSL